MCNTDKQSFIAELTATQKTIKAMTKPVEFTTQIPEFKLTDALNQYEKDYRTVGNDGIATKAEMATNKMNLAMVQKGIDLG